MRQAELVEQWGPLGIDRVADGQGRLVNFRNTVLILTSNIGSPIIQEFYAGSKATAETESELQNVVRNELKAHFRPEFLNRLDAVVFFDYLTRKDMRHVLDLELQKIRAWAEAAPPAVAPITNTTMAVTFTVSARQRPRSGRDSPR